MSTEEYWEEFSTQFKPQLSEKVVIADRRQEADALLIATGAAESLAGVLAWTPMNSCAQAVTREGQPAELPALVATVAFRSAARPCA
ncbi:MAG: hypothetical protein ACJ8G7_23495 [Rhizobacter sp.]